MDGYNIYTAILHTKTKVDTYCVGIAASIAAVIFQAGRTRTMADYGLLIYHNPYGGDDKQQLEKMTTSIATMVATRSGKTVNEVLKMMAKTSWITASEAFGSGLCDEMLASNEMNKKRSIAITEPKAMYMAGADILNSILNITKPIQKMNKVTNRLNLVEGSNEDAILNAIEAIENKVKNADSTIKKMEDELKAKKAEMKKKADSEMEAKAKAEAEAADVKNRAEIEKFVAAGKIKNEAVGEWIETAKVIGLDKVTNMLSSLPTNKKAASLEVHNLADEKALTGVVANKMAEVRNKINQ